MKTTDTLGKIRAYWSRGHATIALFLSLLNSNILIYNFLIKDTGWIPERYNHFWLFFPFSFFLVCPFVLLLGRLDFKKGTYRQEAETAAAHNPIWIKLFKKLDDIEKEVLNKTPQPHPKP